MSILAHGIDAILTATACHAAFSLKGYEIIYLTQSSAKNKTGLCEGKLKAKNK